jgi:hypothetical protein
VSAGILWLMSIDERKETIDWKILTGFDFAEKAEGGVVNLRSFEFETESRSDPEEYACSVLVLTGVFKFLF